MFLRRKQSRNGVLRVLMAVLFLFAASQAGAQNPLTITSNAAQNITQTTALLGGTLSRALGPTETLSEAWVDIVPVGAPARRVSLGTNLSGVVASGVVAAFLSPSTSYSYTFGVKITYSNGSYRTVVGDSASFNTQSVRAPLPSSPTVASAPRTSFSQQAPSGMVLSCETDANCAYWTWTSPDGNNRYLYWVFQSSQNDYSMTVAAYPMTGAGNQAPVTTWTFWGGRYNQGVSINPSTQTVDITAQPQQQPVTISVPFSTIQMPNQPRSISVLSAIYGDRISTPSRSTAACTSSKPIDLLWPVQSCDGRTTCSYEVPWPSGSADPAQGCWKNFQVKYTCQRMAGASEYVLDIGGVSSEAALQTVSLSCANLPGITIVDATYGASTTPSGGGATCPTVPRGNRTSQMGATCNGNPSCTFLVSADAQQGGDPATNCFKNFTVDYRCSGSDNVRSSSLPAEANGQPITLSCP